MSEKKGMGTGVKVLLGVAALGAGACVCGGSALGAVFLATRGADDFLEDPDFYPPPPPGNPKGIMYAPVDAGPPDTGMPVIPPPGNPKGMIYDQGPVPPTPPPPVPPVGKP